MKIRLSELRQIITDIIQEQNIAFKRSKPVKAHYPGPKPPEQYTNGIEQEDEGGEDGEDLPPADLDS